MASAPAANAAGNTDQASPFAMLLAAAGASVASDSAAQHDDETPDQSTPDETPPDSQLQSAATASSQISAQALGMRLQVANAEAASPNITTITAETVPDPSGPAAGIPARAQAGAAVVTNDAPVPPQQAPLPQPTVLPHAASAAPQPQTQPSEFQVPASEDASAGGSTAQGATAPQSGKPSKAKTAPADTAQPQPVALQPQQPQQPDATQLATVQQPQPAVQAASPQAATDTSAAPIGASQPADAASQPAAPPPVPNAPGAPQGAAKPGKDSDKTKPAAADARDGVKTANAGASADAAPRPDAKANAVKAEDGSAPSPPQAQPAQASPPDQAPAAQTANLTAPDVAPQQAPTAGTQAAPTAAHIQVTAQHQPNMPQLAVEIAAKTQSGARQFDIRLDPPELGRVEVRLSIDAAGKTSAHLSADQPQTLELLQKDSQSLTRALRDAGLDVSQNGLNFSLRQQSNPDSGAGNGSARSGTTRLNASVAIDSTTNATSAYRAPLNGRLDIRV